MQAHPPFRADQVGSLLRPAALADCARVKQASRRRRCARPGRRRHPRGGAKQEAIGLQAITDGEFSRDWWHLDFLAQLDGVTLAPIAGRRSSTAPVGAAADRRR